MTPADPRRTDPRVSAWRSVWSGVGKEGEEAGEGPADGANAMPLTPRNALSPPPQAQAARQITSPAAEISRTNTPVPRGATPAVPPPQAQQAQQPPTPYAYEHLNDDLLASWQERGRHNLMESAEAADEMMLGTLFQELVRSALDGKLNPEEAGLVVKQLVSERQQSDMLDTRSSFLSTISMLDDADAKNPGLLALLSATNIDPEVIRQDLDVPLLASLSLVRSTFDRMRARKTTNLLYRQANFNLLREETEGYAKLLTEYFNIANESNTSTGSEITESAFHRIMALVGAFDLDVGRVLDITLDISANLLVRAYPFFIKFYRCSSWWPEPGNLDSVKWADDGFNTFPTWALPGSGRLGSSDNEDSEHAGLKQARDESFWREVREKGTTAFFEIGSRKIIDYDSIVGTLLADTEPELDSKGKEPAEDKRKRLNENRMYMRQTRTLPAPGNSDAAQLLGFKLRFYASPARDADDTMPDNLIHFAALLIKIGFISLRDLYPHLHPADEQMPEERTRLEKEKAEKEAKDRPGGGPNKLAMASALTDDSMAYPSRSRTVDKGRSGGTMPKPDSKDDTAPEELPPPVNQKLALLKALFSLGAVPEAMYILGRFPWLNEVDIALPQYLLRIIRHMLSKVAEMVQPLADRNGMTDCADQPQDGFSRPDGALHNAPRPPKAPTKWLGLDEVSDKDGARYRYYYNEWADNIPVCQTIDDVFQLCNTLMGFLGVKVGRDTMILGSLIRLARKSLTEDLTDENRSRWLELMRRILVPALSMAKHNVSLTDEMYHLLMLFPVTTRYSIYAEWFTGKTSRLPDIKVAFDHNRAEVKDVLRRVSMENVKTQSRALGKVSYSSPGVLMMFMIGQLESYSNMIPALVECTKYFPKLAYDVLTWCLINSLSGQGRDRIQADGMLTSSWLQALSQFVAALFMRYEKVNPSPILQYLASELRNGDSTDLEMFEQVLTEMAGIRSDTEFNDAQVRAMAGGEQLQAWIMQQLGDTRHARKSSAKRLIRALAEPGLIGQTLIAIAQERQMYPHHESSKFMPLKVLGNNLDKIHNVFLQYLDVLRTNLRPEEFEAAMPDVVALVGDFGLQPGIAFTIWRSVIAHRMLEHDKVRPAEPSQEKAQTNGDVEMHEADAKTYPSVEQSSGGIAMVKGDAKEPADRSEPQGAPTPRANGLTRPTKSLWHPILGPLIEQLPGVTAELQDRVSMPFYVTFWTLTLSDVYVRTESYKAEIDRITAQIGQINLELQLALASRDRTGPPRITQAEADRKKRALNEMCDKLRLEPTGRVASWNRLSTRLTKKEKNHWFDHSRKREDLDRRHLALLQDCFLPRVMLSAVDAQYSFVMLRMLHDKGTPGFSTLVLIQQLLRKQALAAIVFQCTGQEAQHFGRFLNEVLKMLASWHAKKEDYETQALGKQKLPGFAVGAMDYDAGTETWKFLDYESFRRLDSDWHHAIHGALLACFESGEYMHIRNGIVVLKAVVGVYPQLVFQGNQLISAMEKLSTEETRQDLKLMALSLLGPLKNREKQWVMPQAFRLNDPSKGPRPASRAPSARAESPLPIADTPKLNAAVAEFVPGRSDLPNGTVRKESVAGVEDGEVEEEKAAAANNAASTEKQDAPALKSDSTQATPANTVQTESRPEPRPKVEQRAASPTPVSIPQKPASKPPTPAPSISDAQLPSLDFQRHEPSRPSSALPSRPQGPFESPSRPEQRAEYSNKPLPPPLVARSDNRSTRRGDDGYGRLDHPHEARTASREHSPGVRSRPRSPSNIPRTHARDERNRPGREEPWGGSRRDAPTPTMYSRSQDPRDRPNGSMAPPPAHGAGSFRPDHNGTPQQPVRPNFAASAPAPTPSVSTSAGTSAAQALADDAQFRVNNERQRLIDESESQARRTQQPRQQPPQQSKTEPRRDRDVVEQRDGREDRIGMPNGRPQPTDTPRDSQARPDNQTTTDLAPNGPRKGRLSRETGHEESTYGRLNGPAEQPLPGSRLGNNASGRGERSIAAPQPMGNLRSSDQSMPSPSAARRPESPGGPRGQGYQSREWAHDSRNIGASGRQQQPHQGFPPAQSFQQQQPQPPQAPQPQLRQPAKPEPSSSGIDLAGMNPERLKLFTNLESASAPRSHSSPTSAPPSGPKGAPSRIPGNLPNGPLPPMIAGPPSGPASAVDRQRGHRQGFMINQVMQGGTTSQVPRGQDVSFRGASSRQSSLNLPSIATVLPTQAVASPMEPPQRPQDGPPRPDGPPSRAEPRTEPRREFQQYPRTETRNDPPFNNREEERSRGSRYDHREQRPNDGASSRQSLPGTEDGRHQNGAPRDDRRGRDERDTNDRRNGPRGEDSRRPTPSTQAPMSGPPPTSFAPPGYGSESRRHGADQSQHGGREGNGGRQDEQRGTWREEERRDGSGRGPSRDDDQQDRKRRHEEAPFDPSKRRRSGRDGR
ncbi:THO2 plays a role in transcriptional elongation [Teratosphaeriaceae sp. CCFEE 6253]|nr:THO2 plays a role in transcriptional elongation [Teratosphaeriaceae sp. CCFEE 6253]